MVINTINISKLKSLFIKTFAETCHHFHGSLFLSPKPYPEHKKEPIHIHFHESLISKSKYVIYGKTESIHPSNAVPPLRDKTGNELLESWWYSHFSRGTLISWYRSLPFFMLSNVIAFSLILWYIFCYKISVSDLKKAPFDLHMDHEFMNWIDSRLKYSVDNGPPIWEG
jgi:hypothetical protein